MKNYNDKWNQSEYVEKQNENKNSHPENAKNSKKQYFTTNILKDRFEKKNDKSYIKDIGNSQPYLVKDSDKHYSFQYNTYKKNKNNKNYMKDDNKTKKILEKNNLVQKLQGFSKYNTVLDKGISYRDFEINNNTIISHNLEKKENGLSMGINDYFFDSKSINSLETQNTINDEDDRKIDCERKIDESFRNEKKFKTDINKLADKNFKLSYLNIRNFDYNKLKNSKNQEPHDKINIENDNFNYKNIKASGFNSFDNNNTNMVDYRNQNFYPNPMFNPFIIENNSYPYYSPGNQFIQHTPRLAYNSFIPSCYYVNMNYNNNSSSNSMFTQNATYQNGYKNIEKKDSLIDEIAKNIKEECKKIYNEELSKKSQQSSKINKTDDFETFINKPQNVKPEINPNKFLIINIKISKETIKILKVNLEDDIFIAAKAFCKENNLNDKILYSIYSKISSGINKLITLPKKIINPILSNSFDIISKIKRNNSFDLSELKKEKMKINYNIVKYDSLFD